MKVLTIIFLATLLSSCSTQLTRNGKNIRLVTASEREKYCKSLDIVTESNGSGWDAAGDARNALNTVRNRAAEMGGNAFRLLSNNTASSGSGSGGIYISSSEAVIQAEVLKCNFPK